MSGERVYRSFYRVPRLGSRPLDGVTPLSDGGGPFGFDIHAALEVDYLVDRYEPDVLIETGTHVGDTLEYLARAYPDLPILSCDLNSTHARVAQQRTTGLPNVQITVEDSRTLLERVLPQVSKPLLYLDAHWGDDWPLPGELALVHRGVVCIDDFDIGEPGWASDNYAGITCGPGILPSRWRGLLYTNSVRDEDYEFPVHQLDRRAGRGYIAVDLPDQFQWSRMFRRHVARTS